jgi:hypothetical protein
MIRTKFLNMSAKPGEDELLLSCDKTYDEAAGLLKLLRQSDGLIINGNIYRLLEAYTEVSTFGCGVDELIIDMGTTDSD